MFDKLNMSDINISPSLVPLLFERWEEGNIEGVLGYMQNTCCLTFVFDNRNLLLERGLYEKGLLYAYMMTRTNLVQWNIQVLRYLFDIADAGKLRELGPSIPKFDMFTLYRGVSGNIHNRRIQGLSWTDDPGVASWFAKRYKLNDPAVFKAEVPYDYILVIIDDRNEREYILKTPLPMKPKRLKQLPLSQKLLSMRRKGETI
jgi:hypothetical protein